MEERVAWDDEVACSNHVIPRLLNSTPPRGKSWVTLRCYINIKRRYLVIPYIYKITNEVNDKIYIGKTLLTPEHRFREHILDSKRSSEEQRPLYSAMNKYGVEKFHMSIVEECDFEHLNEREKYWIEYFGSFKNGYNATIGGDGRPYLDSDLNYNTYIKTKDMKETAKIIGCSQDSVSKVLSIYKINKEDRKKNADIVKSKSVIMIDKTSNQIIKVFSTIG